MTRRPDGNSLALIGVILYLLEFAVFIPLGVSFPAPAETDPVSFYAGRETPYARALTYDAAGNVFGGDHAHHIEQIDAFSRGPRGPPGAGLTS